MTDTLAMTEEENAAFAAMQGGEPPAKTDEPSQETTAEVQGQDEAETPSEAPGKTKTVPHQALHAEREEHKKTRDELRKEREERIAMEARFEERFARIQGLTPAKDEPKSDYPDPDADPFGAISALVKRQQEADERERKQAEGRDQVGRIMSEYQQQAKVFSDENPQFMDAYRFMFESRTKELMLTGATAAQAKARVEAEEIELAAQSLAARRNPAELIYQMAEMRGFRPASAKEEQKEERQAPSAAEKIEKTARGVEQNRSFATAGGGAAPTEMTVQTLLAMPEEEFDAWCAKHPAQSKKLMGG